jgi:rhomboid protease GluP
MFQRQRTGSVVCPSCGKLVGVNDKKCYNCGRPAPGMFGFAGGLRALGTDFGFVTFVTWSCVLFFLASLAADPSAAGGGGGLFRFLSPSGQALFGFGASGALPVFHYGRWWTVLSAGWLHGSLLHIFFNLMWVRQLGALTVEFYGPGRTAIIYTTSCATGFLATSCVGYFLPFLPWPFGGAPITVGASAPLFGLLGALLYYGRRGGGGAHLNQQIKTWAVVLFLFGFIMQGVDNWAHLGGLAGGYGIAHVLNPMRQERGDHLLIGLVLLVASIAPIVFTTVRFLLSLAGVNF